MKALPASPAETGYKAAPAASKEKQAKMLAHPSLVGVNRKAAIAILEAVNDSMSGANFGFILRRMPVGLDANHALMPMLGQLQIIGLLAASVSVIGFTPMIIWTLTDEGKEVLG